jgi:hypothetical protein
VLWKGDTETMKSHVTHLKRMIKEANSAAPVVVMMLEEKIVEIERDIKMEDVRRKIEGWFKNIYSYHLRPTYPRSSCANSWRDPKR